MKKNAVWIMLFATSCSSYYTDNGDQRYLKSKNGPTLVVPPPLNTYSMSHFYDLAVQDKPAKVQIEPPI
jgi:hypothetical protein